MRIMIKPAAINGYPQPIRAGVRNIKKGVAG